MSLKNVFGQENSFYIRPSLGVNSTRLSAPDSYTKTGSNGLFNKRLLTYNSKSISLGWNRTIEFFPKLKMRAGIEYGLENSSHGFPITFFDNGRVDLFYFSLNRSLLKLTISRKFDFYNQRFSLEPILKLTGTINHISSKEYIQLGQNAAIEDYKYDLDLTVWQNHYKRNAAFDFNEMKKLNFEFDINSHYRLNEHISLNCAISLSAKRFLMYNFNMHVYKFDSDGNVIGQVNDLGTFPDNWDAFGQSFRFLNVGIGISYTFTTINRSNENHE